MKLLILAALFCASQALSVSDEWYFPYSLHDDSHDTAGGRTSMDLVELAEKLKLHKLMTFLKFADLTDTIKSGGPFTIFAPSDEAFDHMFTCPYLRKELFKNKKRVAELLTYHVVAGEVLSTRLSNELLAPSLLKVDGKAVNIRVNVYKNGKVVTATGGRIVKVDQKASNGIIHIIDRVMYPIPIADMVTILTKYEKVGGTLATAVKTAGLVNTLHGAGPFTLFAPSNKAFERLPKGTLDNLLKNKTALTDILKYHIVSGTFYSAGLSTGFVKTVEGKDVRIRICPWTGNVVVNKAIVWGPNLSVSNGVIHFIDKVLFPPAKVDTNSGEMKAIQWLKLNQATKTNQFDQL